MIKVGEHITLDIVGTTKEYSPAFYKELVHKIAKKAKVNVLQIAEFKFEPQGYTCLALLAESNISFHTFPEHGVISYDFFTCGKVSPNVAIDILKKEIQHTRMVKKEFDRNTQDCTNSLYNTTNGGLLIFALLAAFTIKKMIYKSSKINA